MKGLRMSAVVETVEEAHAGDRLARRNAVVLAVTQALGGANNAVMLATGGIVGAMLAHDRALATLPISVYVVGLWFGTLPVGALARRFGRRAAFQTGTFCGVLTGLICCLAVLKGSFLLFNVGTFFSGLYAAACQAYRFAAADTASEGFRPKAISYVLIGGIFAGVVGPQLVIFTKDLWPPYLFAASYIAQAGVAVIAAAVLLLLNIPKPPRVHANGRGRPLAEIVRQPRFVVAVVCGVASYAMMNMVMTSAPPLILPLCIGGGVVAFALACALSPRFRAAALAADPKRAVLFHLVRVVAGTGFLVRYARGELPGEFALQAGWGDIVVGLAAPLVAAFALPADTRWKRGVVLA